MKNELLIPPQRVRVEKGLFHFPVSAVLASPRLADALPLGQLAAQLRSLGVRSRVVRDAVGPATVRIHRGGAKHAEGYELIVSRAGVEIVAATDAGAYYAVQTLCDLLGLHGRAIPACRIEDWPDFHRRGVYYDCSRGRVPEVAVLKSLVERLAHWKINEFQLYIENVFHFRNHPAIGRGYDPFQAEELLEVQEHCKLHHVRFVPSLASFGHMEHILGLPQYRSLGNLPGFHEYPGGRTLAPNDPGSIRLVEELFAEFVPLFEAEDFNVCCDETWDLGQGRSEKLCRRVGVGRVYLDYLKKLRALCERHGKRMNAWADIVLKHPEMLGDTPRDIVMLNWDYEARGGLIPRTKEISDAGMPVVVCPSTSGYQTHGTRLDNAIENVARFAAAGRSVGAEGLLNTDWGDFGHRNTLGVAMHGFAHGAAHAWNGRGVEDATFTRRFCGSFWGEARLSSQVEAVGRSYLRTGPKVHLYHGLFEAIDPKADFYRCVKRPSPVTPHANLQTGHIDAADGRTLAALAQELETITMSVPAGTEAFERLAAQDVALAAAMDAVAARRLLIGKAWRGGKKISAAQWKRLADRLAAVQREFTRLWLTRNKPSRLFENLRLFEQARRECAKLAR